MSEHVWCHGPNCHTYRTVDRVRGSKDNKVLRTRKIKQDSWNANSYFSHFCSQGCWNDFAYKNWEQCIAIAPRREALETPIDRVEKIKHENEYHSWTETRVVPIE
jgi:hypothetical protein